MFLTCLLAPIGSDAAVNDLLVYKKYIALRSTDPQLAEEALVVMRRHGLYATPEVVMFNLFSTNVSDDEMARISCKLLRSGGTQSQI